MLKNQIARNRLCECYILLLEAAEQKTSTESAAKQETVEAIEPSQELTRQEHGTSKSRDNQIGA